MRASGASKSAVGHRYLVADYIWDPVQNLRRINAFDASKPDEAKRRQIVKPQCSYRIGEQKSFFRSVVPAGPSHTNIPVEILAELGHVHQRFLSDKERALACRDRLGAS